MPDHNADIAVAFEEIADLLELGDENPFRVRAYRNAARMGRRGAAGSRKRTCSKRGRLRSSGCWLARA